MAAVSVKRSICIRFHATGFELFAMVFYTTSDCLQQFTPSSDWNQKEKTQQSFCCTGSRVGFDERIHPTFMTPIRSCILPESTDNSPRDL